MMFILYCKSKEYNFKQLILYSYFYLLDLFHGVLDTSLLEMVILGHAGSDKKLQAVYFSCPWR